MKFFILRSSIFKVQMKRKLISSTLSLLTPLLAHSLTHLSVESSCIPFEATEIICMTPYTILYHNPFFIINDRSMLTGL